MFQNISREIETEEVEETEDIEVSKKSKIKAIFTKFYQKQNILLYIIAFMLSMVSCAQNMAPFALAIFAATISNSIPAGILYIATLLGVLVGFKAEGLLIYILTSLIFIAMVLIFKPKTDQDCNEKRKLGIFVFLSTVLVQAGRNDF